MKGSDIIANIGQNENSSLNGEASIKINNISDLANLFLVKAKGKLSADVKFGEDKGKQNAFITAAGRDIIFEQNHIKNINTEIKIEDIYHNFHISGNVNANDLIVHYPYNDGKIINLKIDSLKAQAKQRDPDKRKVDLTDFYLNAKIDENMQTNIQGSIENFGNDKQKFIFNSAIFAAGKDRINLLSPMVIDKDKKALKIGNFSFPPFISTRLSAPSIRLDYTRYLLSNLASPSWRPVCSE